MPNPNANAPTGSMHSPPPDTQTLIALLSSLMPLLQRMQTQIGGSANLPLSQQFLFGQGNSAAQNPLIDQQAAVMKLAGSG